MYEVSVSAVIKRINRQLRRNDEVLRVTRGARLLQEVGPYYVIDLSRNIVIHQDVDPEELARELGVLAPHEKVRD